MIDGERQLGGSIEQSEYSFEEGMKEALQRIDQLLHQQGKVVVSVIGSHVRVGKTFFSGHLVQHLKMKGIKTSYLTDMTSLDGYLGPSAVHPDLKMYEVLVFGAEKLPCPSFLLEKPDPKNAEWLMSHPEFVQDATDRWLMSHPEFVQDAIERQNSNYKLIADKCGLPFSKIDLRILIYHPDRKFREYEKRFADIIVRNEKAS